MSQLTVKQYGYKASGLIFQALHDDYGLTRFIDKVQTGHYTAAVYNRSRIFAMYISGLRPDMIKKLRGDADKLTSWVGLPETHRLRMSEPGGHVLMIEIPKVGRHWDRIDIDRLLANCGEIDGLKLPIGLSITDKPVFINYNDPMQSNTGIFGMSQSGKTNAVMLVLFLLATLNKIDLVLIDIGMKGRNFGKLENIPILAHPLVSKPQEAFNMLAWVRAEIGRRASNPDRQYKPLFIAIDEAETLIKYTDGVYGQSREILSEIARMGIQVGVHTVLVTQYPEKQHIGGVADNLQVRLCGRVSNASKAAGATAFPKSGAERLLGYGDFLANGPMGLLRFTVAYVPPNYIANLERGPQRVINVAQTTVEDVGQPVPAPAPAPAPDDESDEISMGMLADMIFNPIGVAKFKSKHGIGQVKAQLIRDKAREIRAWAYRHQIKALPEPDTTVIEAAKEV